MAKPLTLESLLEQIESSKTTTIDTLNTKITDLKATAKAAQDDVDKAESLLKKLKDSKTIDSLLALKDEIKEVVGAKAAAPASGSTGKGSRMSKAEVAAGVAKIAANLSGHWQTKAEIAATTGLDASFVGGKLKAMETEGTAESRPTPSYKGKGVPPLQFKTKKK